MTISLTDQTHTNLLKTIEYKASVYAKTTSSDQKKQLGQFFTDYRIADYMANLFSFKMPKTNTIEILDCGTGHGILSISLLNILIQKGYTNFDLTLYEIDPGVLRDLHQNLLSYKKEYPNITLNYRVIEKNFILDPIKKKFDLIISNPPYFKLKKESLEAKAMIYLIHGQPNIYMLFMAKSADLLKGTGEMVFITPRSFTSGAYFKRFREYLLDTVSLDHIHIFNTRKKHFKNESILQETIITKFSKQKTQNITISSSEDSTFSHIEELSTTKDLIVEKYRNIICIPSSTDDLKMLDLFHAAPNTLQDLGYRISTGKVVTFRNKELLSTTPQSLFDKEKEYRPLLWMHNFKNDDLLFPLDHKKEQYIEFSDRSKALLIPTQNYLLIKRFSSKEQHRRINIGYLYKKDLPSTYVGLENHLNYLYRKDRELTKQEMKKLGSFLVSAEVDQYFRILNGNTQVNAADILNLPVPTELYKE
ncbi:MAG: Eco57I restriction-modification methylase domain-containing protein [Sulfurovum sp.]|nr:Eco57I restriction-modification methylase domain-containing protein [Sulfurovum sp.]